MMIVIVYIVAYAVLMLPFLLFGEFLHHRKNRKRGKNELLNLKEVTVIIPFRNEANKLPALIASIQEQVVFPNSFIFVDDHSTDGGREIISSFNQEYFQVLDAVSEGKKQAIDQAIKLVKTKYILTLDADIVLPADYFEHLSQLTRTALTILPVKMESIGLSVVNCYDLYLSSAMNVAMDGWVRPIMASGANLLFTKELVDNYYQLEEHSSIASGDDMFMLQAALINHQSIQVVSKNELAISTEAPSTMKSFVQQRLRWLGKTKALNDGLANGYGIVQALLQIGFLMLIISLLISNLFMETVILFSLKVIIDCFSFSPYFIRLHKGGLLLLMPFFEFVLPMQFVILGIASLFVQSKWKGREISHS